MRFLSPTMMILLAPLVSRSDGSAPSVYPSVESASRLTPSVDANLGGPRGVEGRTVDGE